MRPILLGSMVAAGMLCGGCCTLVPPAEKYFQRKFDDPTWTLHGFVYAVETRQWDYAYECLCESSRREIGRWKFEIAIRAGSDPKYQEAALFDLIVHAVPDHAAPRYMAGRTQARIKVGSEAPGDDGKLIFFMFDLCFLRESGEWRLDFFETANHLQRQIENPEALSTAR